MPICCPLCDMLCMRPFVVCHTLHAGKVSLSMYKAAEGIEAYVYEDKLEDVDAGSPLGGRCYVVCWTVVHVRSPPKRYCTCQVGGAWSVQDLLPHHFPASVYVRPGLQGAKTHQGVGTRIFTI
eukprot:GHRR01029147.1.p1 GENE.GHRR01029147.1~~GHRR01029147.1.p1  ORF type:complete len:123 (-),score=4.87 GHRR01029147.1:822-1190(-)